MTLKERITEDMKTAMRSGEKDRLAVIRLLQAAIKQREVDERITLDDAQVTSVLEKMIKQRKESIVAFEKGARADLVAKETAEIAVLQPYLPAQLSDAELDAIIAEAISRHRRRVHQGHGQGHGRGEERRPPARPTWARSAPASKPGSADNRGCSPVAALPPPAR